MLSVSEEHIKKQNPQAHLELFGQEYNEESWAICCSDLLIKDEPVDNIVFGDTLGDGQSFDGHPDKKFHYMLANPRLYCMIALRQAVLTDAITTLPHTLSTHSTKGMREQPDIMHQ